MAIACDAAGIALEPRSDGDGVPPVEPVIGIRATPSKRVLIRFVWHRRTQPIASVHKIDCREISFAAPVVQPPGFDPDLAIEPNPITLGEMFLRVPY